MDSRAQRSGRKASSDRVRELVALIGSLSETGDTISIDAISSRLGISRENAQSMMDIICQASGEETGGLLISCNDDETEFTLQYPGVRGKPIRLSRAETFAFFYALDAAGISEDNQLRQQAEAAFAATSFDPNAVAAHAHTAMHDEALVACARSQITGRVIKFEYKGLRDEIPRPRRAVVRQLTPKDTSWHVRAFDLDLRQERTFRLDRMRCITLDERITIPETSAATSNPFFVEIVFYDTAYYDLFEWPGIRVLQRKQGVIHASIPYYGSSSTWLIRRITACNNRVIAKDRHIMDAVREYATTLLDESPRS